MRKNPPCKDCGDREQGCHANCIKYKMWKKEDDACKAACAKKKDAEYRFIAYEKDRRNNMRHRRRVKKDKQ